MQCVKIELEAIGTLLNTWKVRAFKGGGDSQATWVEIFDYDGGAIKGVEQNTGVGGGKLPAWILLRDKVKVLLVKTVYFSFLERGGGTGKGLLIWW